MYPLTGALSLRPPRHAAWAAIRPREADLKTDPFATPRILYLTLAQWAGVLLLIWASYAVFWLSGPGPETLEPMRAGRTRAVVPTPQPGAEGVRVSAAPKDGETSDVGKGD